MASLRHWAVRRQMPILEVVGAPQTLQGRFGGVGLASTRPVRRYLSCARRQGAVFEQIPYLLIVGDPHTLHI